MDEATSRFEGERPDLSYEMPVQVLLVHGMGRSPFGLLPPGHYLRKCDRLSPFSGAPNDGIVAVEETRLEGTEHIEVRAVHTWIMNEPIARLALRAFLDSDS